MRINYSTPCCTDNLCHIRSFLAKQLDSTNLSVTDQNKVVLAVDEACANAIIHGNECDQRRRLKVELKIEADNIQVDIYDVGDYNCPNQNDISRRDIQDNIRTRKKGGLGLVLMHRIMDRVQYYNDGKVTICSLTKRLEGGSTRT